jgi:hypothetical protein
MSSFVSFHSLALCLFFLFVCPLAAGQSASPSQSPPSGFDAVLNGVHFLANQRFPSQTRSYSNAIQMWLNLTNSAGGIPVKTSSGTFRLYVNLFTSEIGMGTTSSVLNPLLEAALNGTMFGVKPLFAFSTFSTLLTERISMVCNRLQIPLISMGASSEILFQCLFNNTDCFNRGIAENQRRFQYLFTVIGTSTQMTAPLINYLSLRKLGYFAAIKQEEPYSQTDRM